MTNSWGNNKNVFKYKNHNLSTAFVVAGATAFSGDTGRWLGRE